MKLNTSGRMKLNIRTMHHSCLMVGVLLTMAINSSCSVLSPMFYVPLPCSPPSHVHICHSWPGRLEAWLLDLKGAKYM